MSAGTCCDLLGVVGIFVCISREIAATNKNGQEAKCVEMVEWGLLTTVAHACSSLPSDVGESFCGCGSSCGRGVCRTHSGDVGWKGVGRDVDKFRNLLFKGTVEFQASLRQHLRQGLRNPGLSASGAAPGPA